MLQFIINLFLSAGVLFITAVIVPGFDILSWGAALLACLLIGFLNFVVRPILLLLTLPVNILTLGLFSFVINGLLLYLASELIEGFNITGWGSALLGAVVLAVVQLMVNVITPGHRKLIG